MTVKQFFKSTTFKCIIALLCVLLISGIFLTIMNGLLSISDEERLSRAISKIYGANVEVENLEFEDGELSSATITEAYLVKDDGNYLVKSVGKEGYSGGTITCWVVVEIADNKVSGIKKVTVDSYTAQTQMAEIKSSFLDKFSTSYKDVITYSTDEFFVTGSTMSSNAICNAVNGAISFVKINVLGEEVAANPYEEFDYIGYINIDQTTHEIDGESVTFHVVTKGYGDASSFKIDITVNEGIITYYEITKNGSTSNWQIFMTPTILDGSLFIEKDLSFFTDVYGNDMQYVSIINGPDDDTIITGPTTFAQQVASNSTYLCMYAGAFATANYQNCIDAEGGNE